MFLLKIQLEVSAYTAPLAIPFSLSTAGQNLFCERPWLWARTELPYRRQKTPRVRQTPYSGSIFLTTVYPTSTHGAHGNSGDKSAGKDVFPSGKGRKCLKSSGNRYSGFLWDSVEKRQIWEKQKSAKKPYFMRFFSILKLIRTFLLFGVWPQLFLFISILKIGWILCNNKIDMNETGS